MCVCVCVTCGCVAACVSHSVSPSIIYARERPPAHAPALQNTATHATQSAAARSLSSSLAPEEALGPPRAYGERLWCGRRPARHPCPLCDFQSPGFARRVAGLPRPQRLGGQEEQGGGGVKDLRLARAAHAPSGGPGRFRICRPPNVNGPVVLVCSPPSRRTWAFTTFSRSDDQHSAEQRRRR